MFSQRHNNRKSNRTTAFTLVELLVVIAIIAILVLVLLPAINAAREAARRNGCMGNVAQLGVALSNYHLAYEVLPPGVVNEEGPIANVRRGHHHGWIVPLLPYIEEGATYRHIDRTKGAYHDDNLPVVRVVDIGMLRCPSYYGEYFNAQGEAMSNYAACHHDVEAPIDADNHGVMFLNSAVRLRDVTDGLTKTIFVGEKVSDPQLDQSWLSGTRGTLRNTGASPNSTPPHTWGQWSPLVDDYSADDWDDYEDSPTPPEEEPEQDAEPVPDDETPEEPPEEAFSVGGFGSHHSQGAMFLFGDGRVEFLTDDIDLDIYQRLGHRADGQLMGSVDDL